MEAHQLSTKLTRSIRDGYLRPVTTVARTARRRPSLDADLIVEATLRLSEDPAVDSFTFRRLGQELGADHTAVYRHFADRDAIMRAAIDRLLADVTAAVDPGWPWDARLRRSALMTFDAARRHPAIGVELTLHTTGGRGERDSIELELASWREAGLDDDAVVRFYAVFSSYVLAAAASVAGLVIAARRNDDDDVSWVGSLHDVDAENHPIMASLRRPLEALEIDRTYGDGVDVIIEAARREAQAAALPRPRRG